MAPETAKSIVQRYMAGESSYKLAQVFGVNRGTVWYHVHKAPGIPALVVPGKGRGWAGRSRGGKILRYLSLHWQKVPPQVKTSNPYHVRSIRYGRHRSCSVGWEESPMSACAMAHKPLLLSHMANHMMDETGFTPEDRKTLHFVEFQAKQTTAEVRELKTEIQNLDKEKADRTELSDAELVKLTGKVDLISGRVETIERKLIWVTGVAAGVGGTVGAIVGLLSKLIFHG